MRALLLFCVLFASAFAACDTNQFATCASGVTAGLLNLANFADARTGACAVYRDFFECIFRACPDVEDEIRTALQGFAVGLGECGFIIPDASLNIKGTNVCVLAGDPHVLKFDRTWQDCKLTSGETVFSDGANTLTVESDADVSWTNKDLTAVRYVKVVTASGTYEIYANETSGTKSEFVTAPINPAAGFSVNPISIVDTNKKTWIRVDRFRSGNPPQYWLNVVIRADTSIATGVCSTGCANGRASPTLEQALKIAHSALEKRMHTRDAASDCTNAGLTVGSQEYNNCVADVGNTGLSGFTNSSTAAAADVRMADDLNNDGGSAATFLSYSAALIASVVIALVVL
jgi:hypothetical protein